MASYGQLWPPMAPYDLASYGPPKIVQRYAVCLGDPRHPGSCPEWMKKRLGNKPATLENKIAMISAKGVTKRMLMDVKAAPAHPQMNSYQAIVMRHRFVKGFNAIDGLNEIASRMGREGLADKPFPLKTSVLMDPRILTSDAFAGLEKQAVPAWRDMWRKQANQLRPFHREGFRTRLAENTCHKTSFSYLLEKGTGRGKAKEKWPHE